MGTAVIGGMLAASALAIFLIPATFYVIEMWSTQGKPHAAPAEGASAAKGEVPPAAH
jgi:HAE1 family hydrophobic/amphiphilic exporter-1